MVKKTRFYAPDSAQHHTRRLADKKELDAKLPHDLQEALEDNDFAVPTTLPENKAGTVVINMSLEYDPGNRALRWTAGMFGAGKGFVNGKIEAVDAATGVVVATYSDSDTTRMGAFGGDFYGSVSDLVEELAEELTEELNTKIKANANAK